ncbi:MAG: plasmid mobilization relaxosome protein MobC [Methylobacter sp.]
MDKGEFLRCSGLDRLAPVVPEPNKQKWLELSNAANNLNQVVRHLNRSGLLSEDDAAELDAIRNTLIEFRAALLGIQE